MMVMKHGTLAAALIAAAFAFGPVSAATAAPVTPGHLAGGAADAAGVVEQVHGFHRSCARSGRAGWHAHTRRGRVACGPRRGRPAVVIRTPGDRVIVKPRSNRVIVRPN